MMDKIVVTAADIEKLLAWRDEHNNLVRSMPVPLREVEIQIVESGISIKCFRSDKKLKLYLDSPACSFTVRGHFRHYKSGKTVWIAEYRKGTGRSRGKTYKIGGDLDDREVRMAVPR